MDKTKEKLGNYLCQVVSVYDKQKDNDFCRGASAALGMVLFMLTTKEYDIEVTETAEMKLERDRAAINDAMRGISAKALKSVAKRFHDIELDEIEKE